MLFWRLQREIDWQTLVITLIVLSPLMLAAGLSGNLQWWRAMIVGMAIYIVVEKVGLAPLGVILHAAVVAAGIILLLISFAVPPLFVLGAASLGGASVMLRSYGATFRSLGSWTFIPILYLASDLRDGSAPGVLALRGLHFLPYLAAAVVPGLILSIIRYRQSTGALTGHSHGFWRLFRRSDHGERQRVLEPMAATFVAVAVTAGVVEWQHLQYGEWVIWSAASVITGTTASDRRKLRERLTGALVGVPLGIGASFILPHDGLTYGLAALAALLTLVAIRRYVLAFGLRCACVALALMVLGQGDVLAASRAFNVVLGGLLGMLISVLMHAVIQTIQGKPKAE
ncbi:FUSC family protein [Acidisoma cellulosilytica]|uniref:FUSC family protein n=1 Tax=Acidisoma cellulosilyticum TaxID=2802395 RepID=A0A964E4Z4_9PROT|nr:FUSC family protein [Acidisoma cellulosilyticum]MCB8881463.1 FUSC family protein [Acidisoma cellulosilyticum]